MSGEWLEGGRVDRCRRRRRLRRPLPIRARGGLVCGGIPKRFEGGTYVLPPGHIGAGALMNPSMLAFAATVRAWVNRLGIHQHVAGCPRALTVSRCPQRSSRRASVFRCRCRAQGRCLLRPYVGAGPRIYDAHLETCLGYEAFGCAHAYAGRMLAVWLAQMSAIGGLGRPSMASGRVRSVSRCRVIGMVSSSWTSNSAQPARWIPSDSFACSVSLSCVRRAWRPESSTQQEGDLCS